jgi:hypothetical protein
MADTAELRPQREQRKYATVCAPMYTDRIVYICGAPELSQPNGLSTHRAVVAQAVPSPMVAFVD